MSGSLQEQDATRGLMRQGPRADACVADACVRTGSNAHTPAVSRPCFKFPGAFPSRPTRAPKAFVSARRRSRPRLVVRAAPALDPTGYLEASFTQTEEAPLLPGRVALYRDGIYVGRAQMKLTPKDETVRLGLWGGREDQDHARGGAQDRRLDRHHFELPRPTNASSRSRCATAMARRSRWRSKIRCRSARSPTCRSNSCP